MKEKLIALAEELRSGACDIRHDLGPMGYLCGKADGIQEAVEEIDNLVKSAPAAGRGNGPEGIGCLDLWPNLFLPISK